MNNGQIDFQDVLQLIELIKSSSNFNELRLRSGDIEIELRRGATGNTGNTGDTGDTGATATPANFPPAAGNAVPPQPKVNGASPLAPALATPPPNVSAAKPRAAIDGVTVIKSPMVGTLYHAAEPGATPFVTVGQRVAPGDQICIIEVMKLMNSINAECHGVVTEVLVADSVTVEFGQELFVISTR